MIYIFEFLKSIPTTKKNLVCTVVAINQSFHPSWKCHARNETFKPHHCIHKDDWSLINLWPQWHAPLRHQMKKDPHQQYSLYTLMKPPVHTQKENRFWLDVTDAHQMFRFMTCKSYWTNASRMMMIDWSVLLLSLINHFMPPWLQSKQP